MNNLECLRTADLDTVAEWIASCLYTQQLFCNVQKGLLPSFVSNEEDFKALLKVVKAWLYTERGNL